jgi:signal transduction histidine kinase
MEDRPEMKKAIPKGKTLFLTGIVALILWVFGHRLPVRDVLELLGTAVERSDSGYLLAAASFLVGINCLRATCLYVGWFLIGDSLAEMFPGCGRPSRLIPVIGIPACYSLAPFFIERTLLHFGTPAALSIASVVLLKYLTADIRDWGGRTIALAMFVCSFQWLDVMPCVTAWGAGRGELSTAIKAVAGLMGMGKALDIAGALIGTGIFLSGVIMTRLLVSYSSRLRHLALLRRRERELARMREERLRDRTIREQQHLVHDLKRPLTVVTGLADVIRETGSPDAKAHADVILRSCRSMDDMVSEILHGESKRIIPLSALLEYVLSQASSLSWRQRVVVRGSKEDLAVPVGINLVRLSRAIVNLLENAARASDGAIELIFGVEGDDAVISVRDHGPGFPEEESGAGSGWNSTGIGLRYVTMVADSHGGSLSTGNDPDGGAVAELRIPTGRSELRQ